MAVNQKLLYRMPEGAEVIGVSRAKFYELVKRGEIKAVKLDGEMRVTNDELARYAQSLPRVDAEA